MTGAPPTSAAEPGAGAPRLTVQEFDELFDQLAPWRQGQATALVDGLSLAPRGEPVEQVVELLDRETGSACSGHRFSSRVRRAPQWSQRRTRRCPCTEPTEYGQSRSCRGLFGWSRGGYHHVGRHPTWWTIEFRGTVDRKGGTQ